MVDILKFESRKGEKILGNQLCAFLIVDGWDRNYGMAGVHELWLSLDKLVKVGCCLDNKGST